MKAYRHLDNICFRDSVYLISVVWRDYEDPKVFIEYVEDYEDLELEEVPEEETAVFFSRLKWHVESKRKEIESLEEVCNAFSCN